MSKTTTYLSSDFLTSHGVPMTKPLRDWLNRAAYLLKTRTNEADRRKYERWAVGVVEDALREPGGIEGKDWSRISPVMPANAVDREPTFLQNNNSNNNNNNNTGSGSGESAVKPTHVDYRNALFAEAMKRAPSELRSFVVQAFGVVDAEVAAGRRRYDLVTFIEVIRVAQELQYAYRRQMELQQQQQELQEQQQRRQEQQQQQQNGASQKQIVLTKPTESLTNSSLSTKAPRHSHEAEKSRKARRTETNSHREDYNSMESSSLPVGSSRTCDFFKDLVSCNTQSASTASFVGKSKELERMYSRYEPTAEDIRPREVLIKALSFVLAKANAKEKQEGLLASARYLHEQLKGMRQDLRVQNIVDEFAVDVYEKHALICLELGDIGEFNQCQASLKKLYEGLPDTTRKSVSDFFCYRLVYLCLGGQYDALSTELISYTNRKTQKNASARVKKSDVCRTLRLCTACEEGDCFTICRLLMTLPHGMHLLLKIYLQKCRLKWLRELLSCIRGMVSMRFIMACLGFTPVEDTRQSEETKETQVFWLDGSYEEAEDALKKFFEMIKFSTPESFSFQHEIQRDTAKRHHDKKGGDVRGDAGVVAVDATLLFKCVDDYVSYLGTRHDARLNNAD
ncbi:uncharacterized protein TM35_000041390 [Trypanosoma theileri]|uniref:SAC3/GANP/THP3 conserved domain-containing protein n=1 Tax=Trypanosoma theileri TaxID=67003 RepID=A0A1X0P4X7_9TRYP|nr:uncharacterized protein TM35_000041390 [Trypanosoma theileri]ORC91925.1 hypothetical protein TM35_000041390 [Trypanosoma theileri]